MDQNRKLANKCFEQALNQCVMKKFGKPISAQQFANQYNLRAYGTTTISRETARKWMKGKTIPDYGKLSVLINWLDLNPYDFVKTDQTNLNHY